MYRWCYCRSLLERSQTRHSIVQLLLEVTLSFPLEAKFDPRGNQTNGFPQRLDELGDVADDLATSTEGVTLRREVLDKLVHKCLLINPIQTRLRSDPGFDGAIDPRHDDAVVASEARSWMHSAVNHVGHNTERDQMDQSQTVRCQPRGVWSYSRRPKTTLQLEPG